MYLFIYLFIYALFNIYVGRSGDERPVTGSSLNNAKGSGRGAI